MLLTVLRRNCGLLCFCLFVCFCSLSRSLRQAIYLTVSGGVGGAGSGGDGDYKVVLVYP